MRQSIRDATFTSQRPFQTARAAVGNCAFRIVQEGLNNARPHARPRHVQVSLVECHEKLRLEIADDGIGFDPARVGDEHFGLQGIRERARLLDGVATTDS